jgi:predicted AlkP superfamily pyrophosphatase or phosphodiesterase
MRRTVVLDVVGLTRALLRRPMPHLEAFVKRGGERSISPVVPAVTCSVQSTYLTGLPPQGHGIVANGWYFRDQAEVWLWRQSNHLVSGEKVWDAARKRDPAFQCAMLFWWYNMYAAVDWSVTPRPIYCADGRKVPDVYTDPPELHDELNAKLGTFPLFHFWGPNAGLRSSEWIAASARHVYDTRKPTLTLVYLPHLDYNLQRLGPDDPAIDADLAAIDAVCGDLIEHFERDGARVIVLSEYGITASRGVVHINRVLRQAGLVRVREELGEEKLDPGASEAFAVADHQIAHVYVKRPERVAEVKALLERQPGIARVLDRAGQAALGLDHARAGELVALSQPDHWFTYYFWLDPARAPDYARTVDIHRKPGYDPVELFLDPAIVAPPLAVGWRLAKKALGFRYLMDVIPLDASLVRGSHGALPRHEDEGPIFASSAPEHLPAGPVPASGVKELILRAIFE